MSVNEKPCNIKHLKFAYVIVYIIFVGQDKGSSNNAKYSRPTCEKLTYHTHFVHLTEHAVSGYFSPNTKKYSPDIILFLRLDLYPTASKFDLDSPCITYLLSKPVWKMNNLDRAVYSFFLPVLQVYLKMFDFLL